MVNTRREMWTLNMIYGESDNTLWISIKQLGSVAPLKPVSRPRILANQKELIASKGFLGLCFSLKYLESLTKSPLNPSCGNMSNLHKIKMAASTGGQISKLLVPG